MCGLGQTPPLGHVRSISGLPRRRSITHRYSITSSARTSNVGGTSRPSALAVFTLVTGPDLVGACIVTVLAPIMGLLFLRYHRYASRTHGSELYDHLPILRPHEVRCAFRL